MKKIIHQLAWKPAALLLTFLLLVVVGRVPQVLAYFATESPRESAGLTFFIFQKDEVCSVAAGLSFSRPFLFSVEVMPSSDADSGTGLTAQPSQDGGDGVFSGGLPLPLPGETVEALIVIEDGDFCVEEIFIPSVKLHYGDRFIFALQGVRDGAILAASFELLPIWSWFQTAPALSPYITLAVSGEGYREDGTVFAFSGETDINLMGKNEREYKHTVRQTVTILGPAIIFVTPGEMASHKYIAVDEDGEILAEASWSLDGALAGVSVDEQTGEVRAEYQAVGERVLLQASVENRGRLLTGAKEIDIQPCPQLEITVPLPGEEGDAQEDGESQAGQAAAGPTPPLAAKEENCDTEEMDESSCAETAEAAAAAPPCLEALTSGKEEEEEDKGAEESVSRDEDDGDDGDGGKIPGAGDCGEGERGAEDTAGVEKPVGVD